MVQRSDTAFGPPRMWLTVLDEERRPRSTVEISTPIFTIGRDADCDLILEDPKISRHHARIDPGAGPVRFLYDLDSSNGTLVNGQPIKPRIGFTSEAARVAEIAGGEILQFGDTIVVTTLSDPRAGGQPAIPASDPTDG